MTWPFHRCHREARTADIRFARSRCRRRAETRIDRRSAVEYRSGASRLGGNPSSPQPAHQRLAIHSAPSPRAPPGCRTCGTGSPRAHRETRHHRQPVMRFYGSPRRRAAGKVVAARGRPVPRRHGGCSATGKRNQHRNVMRSGHSIRLRLSSPERSLAPLTRVDSPQYVEVSDRRSQGPIGLGLFRLLQLPPSHNCHRGVVRDTSGAICPASRSKPQSRDHEKCVTAVSDGTARPLEISDLDLHRQLPLTGSAPTARGHRVTDRSRTVNGEMPWVRSRKR